MADRMAAVMPLPMAMLYGWTRYGVRRVRAR